MPSSRRRGTPTLVVALLVGSVVSHVGGIFVVNEWIWTEQLLEPEWMAYIDSLKEPEEVEVAWVTLPSTPENLTLPDPEKIPDPKPDETKPDETKDEDKPKPEKLVTPRPPKPEPPKVVPPKVEPPKQIVKAPPPPPPKPEPKKKEPPPPKPVIAKVPPPQPKPKVKPPEPPKPKVVAKVDPPKPKPKVAPPKDRKKMIEVDDEKNVTLDTNYDAKHYSDKNRRPEQESRDKHTNLEKTSKGKNAASQKSDVEDDKEIGGEKDQNAQLEDTKQSSLDAKRKREVASVHDGKSKTAEGIQSGNNGHQGESGGGGSAGQGGQGGDGGGDGKPGALSMRNVEGKGAPGKNPMKVGPGANPDDPLVAMSPPPPGNANAPGRDGAPGKAGKPGKKGPKLTLDHQDYKRIVGDDKAKEEVEIARRKSSHKRGRWEKKLAGIQSSLETFTPDVKPGNQTALGTRAHPFALYISRMHNRIHELWGYGYIADLDSKSYSNAMNERSLATTMEIVINTDGSVEKVTIVKPSGQLTFDVAAVDTVMSAGPYEEAPEEIRSSNGKVYVHWTFHRDERLCSPYFADPFILDGVKEGEGHEGHAKHGVPDPSDAVARDKKARQKREAPRKLTRGDDDGSDLVPHVTREEVPEGDPAAAAQTNNNLPTPDDPEAEKVGLAWANAFEKDDIATLVAISDTPFTSRDVVVADDAAGVAAVWRTIMNETERRHVQEWKLLSAAGYRALFGALPPGAKDGTAMLFLVAKLKEGYFTMNVVQQADGTYKVNGFNR